MAALGGFRRESRTAKHSGEPLKTKIWSACGPPKSLGLASKHPKESPQDRHAPYRHLL